MRGADAYKIMREKSITHLHHANSVTTSATFLRLGGLASRGYVEARRLPQTPQYTDAIDRKYGIWHDVFADTVDIHSRARRRNQYGPVLFVFTIDILNRLPADSSVLVTKKNPTKWADGEADDERFFLTAEELSAGLVKGTFDQMVVIRTKAGIAAFPTRPVSLILDEPRRRLSNGSDAYSSGAGALTAAAESSSIPISLEKRECATDCNCVNEYRVFTHFDTMFT